MVKGAVRVTAYLCGIAHQVGQDSRSRSIRFSVVHYFPRTTELKWASSPLLCSLPSGLPRLCWISSPLQLSIWVCPSFLSFALTDTVTKEACRGQGLFHLILSRSKPITEGSQSGTEGRNQSRSHGGALFTGLLSLGSSPCFLIQPGSTSRGVVPPIVS